MKPSEMRDKTPEELAAYETELRDQTVKLKIAQATQRVTNTAQFARIRKDIARVKTIQREREMGLTQGEG